MPKQCLACMTRGIDRNNYATTFSIILLTVKLDDDVKELFYRIGYRRKFA
jgi:hypothetical protein